MNTKCYTFSGEIDCEGTGQDGDLQKGVEWPNPRFTDHGDGTVTDNLTGLIWLKDANCFGPQTWSEALSDCNGLASGSCGLTDGSSAGDWRLPNYRELFSLVDAENYSPALPSGHPFVNVRIYNYWSSTSYTYDTYKSWHVDTHNGMVDTISKEVNYHVWPVRGGQ